MKDDTKRILRMMIAFAVLIVCMYIIYDTGEGTSEYKKIERQLDSARAEIKALESYIVTHTDSMKVDSLNKQIKIYNHEKKDSLILNLSPDELVRSWSDVKARQRNK